MYLAVKKIFKVNCFMEIGIFCTILVPLTILSTSTGVCLAGELGTDWSFPGNTIEVPWSNDTSTPDMFSPPDDRGPPPDLPQPSVTLPSAPAVVSNKLKEVSAIKQNIRNYERSRDKLSFALKLIIAILVPEKALAIYAALHIYNLFIEDIDKEKDWWHKLFNTSDLYARWAFERQMKLISSSLSQYDSSADLEKQTIAQRRVIDSFNSEFDLPSIAAKFYPIMLSNKCGTNLREITLLLRKTGRCLVIYQHRWN
jgi:hypothetical protein